MNAGADPGTRTGNLNSPGHLPGNGNGELCARVLRLCDATEPMLPPGPAVDAVAAVRQRLGERTLRIAVGGRMNAGKSTLVNALLGRRLAATAATECTMLVAWFRRGVQNRVEVRRADGRVYHVPSAPGGGIPRDPARLGSPREEIEEIVVEVTDSLGADDYTLVDTPGMDTLSGLDEVAMRALAQADALLYVMPHPGAGDAEALQALRMKADARMTALNVVGVLSRVDELGSGVGDPWPGARRVAATYTRRLTGMVTEVVPVAGLLAQTAMGDEFTERDTALVRRLAASDSVALDRALYSPDDFLRWADGPLSADQRQRVFTLLGRYGIATAVAAVSSGVPGTRALLGELRRASGIDPLLDHMGRRFVYAADRLRAAAALGVLETGAAAGQAPPAAWPGLDALRAGIDAVRRHPLMRQQELATALADLAGERLALSEPDVASLVALATGATAPACLGLAPGSTPAALSAAAAEQAAHWRRLEFTAPSRPAQRHARTARELCEAFVFDARH
ncbi:dynamin family protein [Streptomyces sp. NPDC088732]|uniref:dynamin family protein n=1 Tax=Streptomyces sp. NPDC088732 TaxID=3365879 RepID=UPI00381A303D